MDFTEWLESYGLGKYAEVFAENDITDVTILADLTDSELESLGVSVGSRKKISRGLSECAAAAASSLPPLAKPAPSLPPLAKPKQPALSLPPLAQPDAPAPALDPEKTVAVAAPVINTVQVQQPNVVVDSSLVNSRSASVVSHSSGVLTSSRIESKGKSSRKATAILVTIGVHVGLAVIAGYLTIFAATKDEPELIASVVPPSTTVKQEMKKKTVQKQVKRSPSSASAAAAPMAQMMRANAEAQYMAPEVTRTSSGPLGVGEGDFGSGAFGVGNGLDGAGAGAGGLFGGESSSGALGTMYDLKQDPRGRAHSYSKQKTFYPILEKMIKSRFGRTIMGDYFSPDRQFSFTCLAVPRTRADVAPELFGVKGKVEPSGWLIHYKGVLRTRGDRIRFHGKFDDTVMVIVDRKLVFCDFVGWDGTVLGISEEGHSEWVNLDKPRDIDIVIGEVPGGGMGGALWVELESQKGTVYPFTTVKLNQKDVRRFKEASSNLNDYTPLNTRREPSYNIDRIPIIRVGPR